MPVQSRTLRFMVHYPVAIAEMYFASTTFHGKTNLVLRVNEAKNSCLNLGSSLNFPSRAEVSMTALTPAGPTASQTTMSGLHHNHDTGRF